MNFKNWSMVKYTYGQCTTQAKICCKKRQCLIHKAPRCFIGWRGPMKSILDQFLNFDDVEDKKVVSESDFSENELVALSQEVLRVLAQKLPLNKYVAYFENSFAINRIEENLMEVKVKTAFIKKMLEDNYLDFLNTSIESALGKKYQLNIICEFSSNERSDQEIENKEISPKKTTSQKPSFSLEDNDGQINTHVSKQPTHRNSIQGIISDKSFNNFIVGSSNNMAHAAAMAVAKEPGKIYPSIYLYGGSGLGKTHLIHAIANKVSELYPQHKIVITSANAFKSEFVHSIKNNEQVNFKDKYTKNIDVLIIDDIHELKNREGTQDEFFHIFNELHRAGKQLIFTSDKHPKEIDGIAERLKTRLSWGLVVDIQPPDFETRMAILQKKAMEIDLFLDKDVIELIAKNIRNNIRELEGCLIQLYAYSSINQIEIDYNIAKDQLRLVENPNEVTLTFEMIMNAIEKLYEVNIHELKSKSRLQQITRARHMAMYLCYNELKSTQKEIAKYFGGRDHTTVVHALKKISEELKNDPKLLSQYHKLKGYLG